MKLIGYILFITLLFLTLDSYIDYKVNAGILRYLTDKQVIEKLKELKESNDTWDSNRRDKLI